VDLTAYRIVQEALTNTIRHSQATRAAVTLCYEPGYITVSITDSGQRPDGRPAGVGDLGAAGQPGPLLTGSGLGLAGIAERVASCGGHLTVGPTLTEAAAHHPDVVLMDIRMPGMDGLEATRLLTDGSPERNTPKVVMLTTFDLDEYVYEALRAGASGFLLKDSPRGDLVAAVRAAAAGNAMLAPTVTRRLIEAFARRPPATSPAPSRLAALTTREREVLVLLARGSSNTEIAAALFVSEATVKTHVGNLLAKLGLRDRVQAVILAYETGIVIPGDPPG
jgi:DNA-binding NarL/FixJ family response regulator